MWLLADITQTGMFLAGIVLLTLILLRRFYRRSGHRKRDPSATHSSHSSHSSQNASGKSSVTSRSLSSAPADVLLWHVEMHDTAREMKAELDSKMRALQLLVGQARAESERLERLLETADSSQISPRATFSDVSSPVPCDSRSARTSPIARQIVTLGQQGGTAEEIATRLGASLHEVKQILRWWQAGGDVA